MGRQMALHREMAAADEPAHALGARAPAARPPRAGRRPSARRSAAAAALPSSGPTTGTELLDDAEVDDALFDFLED